MAKVGEMVDNRVHTYLQLQEKERKKKSQSGIAVLLANQGAESGGRHGASGVRARLDTKTTKPWG